jgi:hypothetical protein
MSQEERRRLAHALAALDETHILTEATFRRRRRAALLVFMGCCVVLAGWIVVLEFTLPRHYTSRDWREAWVGFDIALLAAFAFTGWAAWHERQVLILCLTVTGTLLCCDAWFDIVLDVGSHDLPMSVASAVVAELPLAAGMFIAAWRLMRMSVGVVMNLEGLRRPVPALWRVPLFAEGLDCALPARYRERGTRPPGQPAAPR